MRLVSAIFLAVCVLAAPASAGHELPFYPSYYPQEIRVDTLDPGAAAAELRNNTLHAYVGADPFANATAPAHVRAVESLGSYLVVTFKPAPGRLLTPKERCETGRRIVGSLAAKPGVVFHPYPVTPYHADYLQHADLAEAARRSHTSTGGAHDDPDVAVEEIALDDLLASGRGDVNGWLGPPWLKEGWFHAYLLQGGSLTDPAARQAVETTYRRLVTGSDDGLRERLTLERQLVSLLGRGCERLVAGYTVRREPFNAEFSAGVENIAWDAHAGFTSAIFLRTVKLKDFPWNGWLRLGVPTRPAAAWNPIGGFIDPAGRLLWFAVGDPAFFPSPYSASWIGNRTTTVTVTGETTARIEVPKDALLPESGTGRWREVGSGQHAHSKIVYRVLASAFHDDSRMTVADTLYGLGFAYRGAASPSQDPMVAAATARLREWLAGVRLVRVDAIEREFGEVKFVTTVQTIEAYGRYALADPLQAASVAPPWSAVPWPLMALMEEAVQRGIGAFSEAEARRRGIPWLDLVRDSRVRDRLAALLAEMAQAARVPATLTPWVTPAEARERWAALKRFYDTHGHFLVTNGPYRLGKWSDDSTVLEVFRDFSYPLGVGSYDRYPIPRRAYVTRIEPRQEGLEIHAEIEMVHKFLREYRIVREPLDRPSPDRDARDVPVCRYVVIGPDGEVTDAGTATHVSPGFYRLSLKGKLKPGAYAISVALYLGDNAVNPEIKVVAYRAS